MKKLIVAAMLLVVGQSSFGQSTPLFNQKLTDYFNYDPSRTGWSGGSAIFTHQRLSSAAPNAPITNYAGAHTRLWYDRLGVGGGLFLQQTGIFNTYRFGVNVAYHLKMNDQISLSFGLSPEFIRGELDLADVFVLDAGDPVIDNYANDMEFDVTTGVSIHHSLFDAGIVAHRLQALFAGEDDPRAFSGMMGVYAQGKMPVRYGKDLIEPMLFFNRLQDGSNQVDIGGFYTFEELVFFGAMYRTPSIASLNLGYYIKSKLILGYSFQTPLNSNRTVIGSSHEITVRFNFNKQYFESRDRGGDTDSISPAKKGN